MSLCVSGWGAKCMLSLFVFGGEPDGESWNGCLLWLAGSDWLRRAGEASAVGIQEATDVSHDMHL